MRYLRLVLSLIMLATCVHSATSPSATDKPSTPTQVTLQPTPPEKQPLVGKGEHHLNKEESASSQQQPSPSLLTQSIKHALIALISLAILLSICLFFVSICQLSTDRLQALPKMLKSPSSWGVLYKTLVEKQKNTLVGQIVDNILYVLIYTFFAYRRFKYLDQPIPKGKSLPQQSTPKQSLSKPTLIRSVVGAVILRVIPKLIGNSILKKSKLFMVCTFCALHIFVTYLIFACPTPKNLFARHKRPPHSTTKPKIASASS